MKLPAPLMVRLSPLVEAARGEPLLELPRTTMIGALLHYITNADPGTFQPMKAAMGLFPPLETEVRGKRARYGSYTERATADLEAYLESIGHSERVRG